jgi:hypothetical protein
MTAVEIFTNYAITTVTSGGTDAPSSGTTESWTVASSSSFPAASNTASPPTQFHVADPAAPTELILVTNVSGTTWSVTRGAESSTPVAHASDFNVKQVISAAWLQALNTLYALTVPVAIAQGGTGQTTAAAAINALSPMTTLGDLEYQSNSTTVSRLAGNTSATKQFLTQTGTGSASAAPAWGPIASTDLPSATTSAQGAVELDGTATDIKALGTQSAGSSGKAPNSDHVHPTTGLVLTSSLPLVIGSGGTGQTTAAAAYNALSPMTATGDMEYDSSGGTAARLPVGSSGQFLGVSGGVPAWSALPAASTSAAGIVEIDGTANDIQPTSTAASAGSKGQAADAKHVHTQNYGGIFGDGSDGAATLNGTNTYGWCTLSGSSYYLNRDVMLSSLTISSSITLYPNGWHIIVQGTMTNNGTITANGGNASGTNGATGGSAPNGLAGGTAGTTGGQSGVTGTTGTGGEAASETGSFGAGNGGAGGNGTSGSGGASRGASSTTTAIYHMPTTCLVTGIFRTGTFNVLSTISGSAGAGDGTNAGGGGGGGAGIVMILAWSAVNNGTINANGGNGGTPTTGNCGGGGGGGGGLILVYTLSAWTAGTANVAGGSPGAGVGSGTSGTAGTSGTVLNVIVQ